MAQSTQIMGGGFRQRLNSKLVTFSTKFNFLFITPKQRNWMRLARPTFKIRYMRVSKVVQFNADEVNISCVWVGHAQNYN